MEAGHGHTHLGAWRIKWIRYLAKVYPFGHLVISLQHSLRKGKDGALARRWLVYCDSGVNKSDSTAATLLA